MNFKKLFLIIICSLFLSTSEAWSASLPSGLTNSEYNNALDMANLSARVYDNLWDKAFDVIAPRIVKKLDYVGNTSQYEVIETYNGNWNGFDAKLYYNNNSDGYVLVFRGTEVFSVFDWIQDINQALNDYLGGVNISQYEAAVNLAVSLKAQYGNSLQLTGHSLGGGLAQVAGLATGLKTTCFEAAGTTNATLNSLNITQSMINSNVGNITHFNVRYDPLSDFDCQMNNEAPFSNTLRYGSNVYWLKHIFGTGGSINPLRLVNHFYHTFVYQLTQKKFL